MSGIEPVEWQPGDPLHPGSGVQYRTYLFNFRDDPDGDECRCGDAASWPEPQRHNALTDGDEVGDLIDWHRRERIRAEVRDALVVRHPKILRSLGLWP